MQILNHLDKNNLHHAYLIEGERDAIMPEILEFVQGLGVETSGNSDFSHIHLDAFKIEDERNVKVVAGERGYTDKKKIFLISTNSFLLEAQNTLLKTFEEPIENTIFFLVVPDKNALLPTFLSLFHLISRARQGLTQNIADRFISMSMPKRIEFIKELLSEPEEEDVATDSVRSKALKFLNDLESVLHQKMSKRHF